MEYLGPVLGALLSAVVVGGGAYLALGRKVLTMDAHRKICEEQERDFCRRITEVGSKLEEHKGSMDKQFGEVKADIKGVGDKLDAFIAKFVRPLGGN